MPPDNTNSPNQDFKPDDGLAADVIREKVARIYSEEPSAVQEIAETAHANHRSKHQEFMYQLSTSGKDLASIQTEWHNYYQNLPANEKHQVWHEFYASQSALTGQPDPAQQLSAHKHEVKSDNHARAAKKDDRPAEQIRSAIRDKVTAGGKLQAKHHLQSLMFGLSMGAAVLVIFLFSFFNELVIAPFIQPSRAEASTPLIIANDTSIASDTPQVIIPKINVQIPTDFSATTTDESQIETALDSGVVHYPTTVRPGELGNAAFFGHSSNNIFNKGKYKFAFVLLHTLEKGDTFYLTYNRQTYVYRVVSKKIVEPSQVDVLGTVNGYNATATLITCDPPGTSLHRLVVVGEQIKPDPTGNTTAQQSPDKLTTSATDELPGNGLSLSNRFGQNFISKIGFSAVLAIATLFILRKIFHISKRNR